MTGPSERVGGIAGIAAGIGLAVEACFFAASGWTPEAFAVPRTAVAYLATGGDELRAAVFAGFWNLACATLFFAALAARLGAAAPSRGAATLVFAIVGIAAHGLVPVSLWLGVPAVVGTAAGSPEAAATAWSGFSLVLAGAGGLGSLFMGLAMLAAGWAVVGTRMLAAGAGWAGILAGLAAVVSVAAAQTPLDPVARAAFMPTILLALAFRLWCGIALLGSSPARASARSRHTGAGAAAA